MPTRKIKDAVDHGTKELIYFKGHAKATYMSDGYTVEDTINNIESKIDLSDYVTTDELEGYAKIYATKEELNSKQDKLLSGSNIKTINGNSILGSGDITINSSSAYPLVEIQTYSGGLDSGYVTINPNTFYVLSGTDSVGSTSQVEITLGEATTGVANEYLFQFNSGSNATILGLPDSIKFNSDFTVEANKTYQISILNGLGTVMSWESVVIDDGGNNNGSVSGGGSED